MSRNYGYSRNMYVAGRKVLTAAQTRKEISFSTSATIGERWKAFCDFALEQGVKKMEAVTRELVINYGTKLAREVSAGKQSASTAQNAVSAVNTVLNLVQQKQWKSVLAVKDCGIAKRSYVRVQAPADCSVYERAVERLSDRPREQALIMLCREFGLRAKEASLLRVDKAFEEALAFEKISVEYGTKGGRFREVPITSRSQIQALYQARLAKKRVDDCLLPKGTRLDVWLDGPAQYARNAIKAEGGKGLHDLRAAYACSRYKLLTGHPAPCVAGSRLAPKEVDRKARMTISEELGHGRIDVLTSYVGSSK